MTPEQSKVKTWMQKAGQDTPSKPTIPSLEVRKLRAKLILEEAFETIEKGLGLAVRYTYAEHFGVRVSYTYAERFGVRVSSSELDFVTVKNHEPNLVELADGCADLAVVNLGTACACGIDLEPVFNEVCRSNDSKFIDGHRRDDGKWIKGPSYSPANIAPILEQQTNQ